MMTVKDLRETLNGIPDHYKIWMTLPDDELPIVLVTHDKAFIRLCAHDTEIPASEFVLFYDQSVIPRGE